MALQQLYLITHLRLINFAQEKSEIPTRKSDGFRLLSSVDDCVMFIYYLNLYIFMEISLEGTISKEVQEMARRGEVYPYLVCGVDLYVNRDAAGRDCAEIDESRQCPWDLSLFFTGRHYRIVDLRNPGNYSPCSSIDDVRDNLVRLNVQESGVNTLREPVFELEDGESAYVLTPLDDVELRVLQHPDLCFHKTS